jgi:hypothetical protein
MRDAVERLGDGWKEAGRTADGRAYVVAQDVPRPAGTPASLEPQVLPELQAHRAPHLAHQADRQRDQG